MQTSKILIFLTILLAVGVGLAFAGPPMQKGHGPGPIPQDFQGPQDGPGHMGQPFWKNPELAKKLQLTDEQIEKLESLDFQTQEKEVNLRADFEKARLRLEKAFSKSDPSTQEVQKAANQIASAQGQMFMLKIEHRLGVNKLLSVDQRKLLPPPAPGR